MDRAMGIEYGFVPMVYIYTDAPPGFALVHPECVTQEEDFGWSVCEWGDMGEGPWDSVWPEADEGSIDA